MLAVQGHAAAVTHITINERSNQIISLSSDKVIKVLHLTSLLLQSHPHRLTISFSYQHKPNAHFSSAKSKLSCVSVKHEASLCTALRSLIAAPASNQVLSCIHQIVVGLLHSRPLLTRQARSSHAEPCLLDTSQNELQHLPIGHVTTHSNQCHLVFRCGIYATTGACRQ